MIIALAYCHKDAVAALHLMLWIKALSKSSALSSESVVISCSKLGKYHSATDNIIRHASEVFGQVFHLVLETEDERGWPWSPNHIFRETIKSCHQRFRKPILWIEPDSIPTKCDWFQRIKEEYKRFDPHTTFMGPLIPKPIAHMNGVGVYPINAMKLAPSICNPRLNAPWDVASGPEHYNYVKDSKLFKHIWETQITRDTYEAETALFHRDKLGRTIELLDIELTGSKLPSRCDLTPIMETKYYHTENATKKPKSSGIEFTFEPYTVVAGAVRGILAIDSEQEQLSMAALVSDRHTGITEITQEKYEACRKKKLARNGGLSGSIAFESGNRHIAVQVAKPVQSSQIVRNPAAPVVTATGEIISRPIKIEPPVSNPQQPPKPTVELADVATLGQVIPSAPVQTFQVPRKRGRPKKIV